MSIFPSTVTGERKCIDPYAPLLNSIDDAILHRDWRDRPALQPHSSYARDMLPSSSDAACPPASYCTRLQHTSVNRSRCPIRAVSFMPDQAGVLTGATSGELTIWHADTFNHVRGVTVHNNPTTCLRYCRLLRPRLERGHLLLTGNEAGGVRILSPSLAYLAFVEAHKEAVRAIDLCPSEHKMATGSDDGTIRLWDFATVCATRTGAVHEAELRGHNFNVSCLAWHPSASLLASGSKDHHIKLWDPRDRTDIGSVLGFKNWVLRMDWNANGNWLLASSRDQTLRVFDIRVMRDFTSVVSEHKGGTSIAWHPSVERLFAVGHMDGCLQHWLVGHDFPQDEIPYAHDGTIWDLAWAPTGTLLVTGSHDHSTKFWARSRPGDTALQYAYQGNPIRAQERAPVNNPNRVPIPGTADAAARAAAVRDGIVGTNALATSAAVHGLTSMTFEEIAAEASRLPLDMVPIAPPSAAGAPAMPRAAVPTGGGSARPSDASRVNSKTLPAGYACDNCGGSHWKNECPMPPQSRMSSICAKCHKRGHWARNCPELNAPTVGGGAAAGTATAPPVPKGGLLGTAPAALPQYAAAAAAAPVAYSYAPAQPVAAYAAAPATAYAPTQAVLYEGDTRDGKRPRMYAEAAPVYAGYGAAPSTAAAAPAYAAYGAPQPAYAASVVGGYAAAPISAAAVAAPPAWSTYSPAAPAPAPAPAPAYSGYGT